VDAIAVGQGCGAQVGGGQGDVAAVVGNVAVQGEQIGVAVEDRAGRAGQRLLRGECGFEVARLGAGQARDPGHQIGGSLGGDGGECGEFIRRGGHDQFAAGVKGNAARGAEAPEQRIAGDA